MVPGSGLCQPRQCRIVANAFQECMAHKLAVRRNRGHRLVESWLIYACASAGVLSVAGVSGPC